MEKITVAEALAQGYTKCMRDVDDWSHVFDISELEEIDFTEGKFALAEKESRATLIAPETIRDAVLDDLACQEDEIGCDYDRIDGLLDDIDWKEMADKINSKLDGHTDYWFKTDIELLPNPQPSQP